MALRILVLATGGIGSGKSTFLSLLRDAALARGIRCGGILGPGTFDAGGAKQTLLAENAANGERWLLAETGRFPPERRDDALPEASVRRDVGQQAGPRIGRFRFSGDGFERALRVLSGHLDAGVDLLFLDEAGPLELNRREGYYGILLRLRDENSFAAALAVRPSLVERLRELLVAEETVVVDVGTLDRDAAAGQAGQIAEHIRACR